MSSTTEKNDIITIPNILSILRIIMIPIIAVLYCGYEMYLASTVLIILSGITDVADGWIARKFNMTSDFGKILDPVADKLTQATLVLCLFMRFPNMIYLFILMAIKETLMGVTGLLGVQRSGEVHGADWHGKLTTVLLYGALFLHVVWFDIPIKVSNILLVVVACMMIVSLVLYVLKNMKLMKKGANK